MSSVADFPNMDPGESRIVTFDFTTPLGSASIVSVVWGIASIGGLDPFAASRISGPTIVGKTATTQVSDLVGGIKYYIQAAVTDNSTPANVYVLHSHITCPFPA